MGFPAARMTDLHVCAMTPVPPPPIPPGLPILMPCMPNVLIGYMPAARMTDLCVCIPPPPLGGDAIVTGAFNVLIGGLPAARMTDLTAKGGTITTGFPTVLIGVNGVVVPTTVGASVLSPVCQSLASLAQENAKAQEMAGLAGAAYEDPAEQNLPNGWEQATQEDLKDLNLVVDGEEITGLLDQDDFHYQVFARNSPGDGQREYTVAFRGTRPTSANDWGTNIGQGLGLDTGYYSAAAEVGRQSGAAQPGRVHFTGHSLGGGMASAAAAASGGPAHTFNAAGLHNNSIQRYGNGRPDNQPVQAYYVEGDVLSSMQDTLPLVPSAAGNRHPLKPAQNITAVDAAVGAAGTALGGLGAGASAMALARGVRLHLMEAVNGALAQEGDNIVQQQGQNGCP